MDNKVIIPTFYEQQIILTCKGHNLNEHTIEAIRDIISLQYKQHSNQIENNIIYRYLIKIVKKYVNKEELEKYMYTLFDRNDIVNITDALDRLIGIIGDIIVFNNLGQELIQLNKDNDILN